MRPLTLFERGVGVPTVSLSRLLQGEVDLIVERSDQRVAAFEVKLSATVSNQDVKNLLWLRDRIGADFIDGIVINTGSRAYRRSDGIGVVPAALLGP